MAYQIIQLCETHVAYGANPGLTKESVQNPTGTWIFMSCFLPMYICKVWLLACSAGGFFIPLRKSLSYRDGSWLAYRPMHLQAYLRPAVQSSDCFLMTIVCIGRLSLFTSLCLSPLVGRRPARPAPFALPSHTPSPPCELAIRRMQNGIRVSIYRLHGPAASHSWCPCSSHIYGLVWSPLFLFQILPFDSSEIRKY